jgi:hypothetical protein
MFSTCTFLWENGGTTKPNYNLVEGWNSVAITHAGGCIVIDSVFIPSSPPVIDSAIVIEAACFGDNSGSIQVVPGQVGGQLSYTWDNGQSGAILPNLSSGMYTLIAQDSRPCIDTITYFVGQPDSLTLGVTFQQVMCHGDNSGNIYTSGSGGTAPYTLWSNGNAMAGNDLTSLNAGIYNLQLIDSLGCLSAPMNVTINEPSPLTGTITATPASGLNALDGTASVTISGGIAPYAYSWNDPNNQTDSLAVYLNPGLFAVLITDANGCEFVDSIYLGALEIEVTKGQQPILYPNPTQDKQFLLVPEHWVGGELNLFSSDGKRIRSWIVETTKMTIEHDGLENGTYYFQFQNSEILPFKKLR